MDVRLATSYLMASKKSRMHMRVYRVRLVFFFETAVYLRSVFVCEWKGHACYVNLERMGRQLEKIKNKWAIELESVFSPSCI